MYKEMKAHLKERTDPVTASYMLFNILSLEHAFEVYTRAQWRARVARIIRLLRLYIRDAD